MGTISLAGVGLLLAALGAVTTAPRAAGAADLSVELSNGLLSLHAEDVPRRAILDEIARVTDVRIRVTDGAAPAGDETPTTLVLEDVRIDDAVRRLLTGRGFVLVYSSTGRLREARVDQAATSASPRPPPPDRAHGGRPPRAAPPHP